MQNFVSLVENQFDAKVKCIRSDNGPKFFLKEFYASKGIFHQTNSVETPQQNGRLERKHQHILNVARALMFQSHLPSYLWSYAINHVVFLINRVPSPILYNKTPFELLYNKPLDFQSIKVFGCLCYASTQIVHHHKFDPRSRRGIFLGFKTGMKGFIVFYLDIEIVVSRHVLFHEMHFPFSQPPLQSFHPHYTTLSHPSSPSTISFEPTSHPLPSHMPCPSAIDPKTKSKLNESHHALSSPDFAILPNQTQLSPPQLHQLRHSTRLTHPPRRLADYQCNLSFDSPHQSSPRCAHPLSAVLDYSHISSSHRRFILSLCTEQEPRSFKKASKHPC